MSDIREILKLTRNPKAPDVMLLKLYKNEYNFWRVDCPTCGEQQRTDGFYAHWTLKHDPDWKLNLVLDWHKAELERVIGKDVPIRVDGKLVKKGDPINIDLSGGVGDERFKQSCINIQENGRNLEKAEQRKRAGL